jgi:hypothetical protein
MKCTDVPAGWAASKLMIPSPCCDPAGGASSRPAAARATATEIMNERSFIGPGTSKLGTGGVPAWQ